MHPLYHVFRHWQQAAQGTFARPRTLLVRGMLAMCMLLLSISVMVGVAAPHVSVGHVLARNVLAFSPHPQGPCPGVPSDC